MNKRVIAILSAVMISVAVIGCGTQNADMANSKKTTTTKQTTQKSTQKNTTVESTKTETEKQQKNGYNENTNQEYSVGSIKFEIPSYFNHQESNNSNTSESNNNATSDTWILEKNYALFLAGAGSYSSEPTVTSMIAATKGLFNESTNISVDSSAERMIDGHSGGQFVLQLSDNDSSYTWTETYVCDENNSMAYLLILVVDPKAEYSYTEDYSKIVNSIQFVSTDTNTSNQSSDSATVTPELKEFLDSYENFMDEYVAFMNKYKENPSDLELLSQYSDYLNKYTDFMQKANEYGDNEDEMSTADLNYYLEVTNRVNQKLLQVAADGSTE